MPMFEVWMEGYAISNGVVKAKCLGKAEGETLADAAEKILTREWRYEAWRWFNKERCTYFNKPLYSNAMDARRAHG